MRVGVGRVARVGNGPPPSEPSPYGCRRPPRSVDRGHTPPCAARVGGRWTIATRSDLERLGCCLIDAVSAPSRVAKSYFSSPFKPRAKDSTRTTFRPIRIRLVRLPGTPRGQLLRSVDGPAGVAPPPGAAGRRSQRPSRRHGSPRQADQADQTSAEPSGTTVETVTSHAPSRLTAQVGDLTVHSHPTGLVWPRVCVTVSDPVPGSRERGGRLRVGPCGRRGSHRSGRRWG